MAEGANDKDSGEALQFELSPEAGFAQTTEWIRNHVLLGEPGASMLDLNICVAAKTQSSEERRVSIFMDPTDGYIVGFRGKDAVYMLHEEGRTIVTKLHEANLISKDEHPRTPR